MRQTLCCILVLCAVTVVPVEGSAREGGFPANSCSGCHRGGGDFKPRFTIAPERVDPGQTVVLSVHVPTRNGPAAGLFLTASKGLFTEIPGEGVRKTAPTQATHTQPKTAEGGETTFRIRWTAPNERGGVEFDVTAVSANRNGGTSGDSEGIARINLAFGCEGVDGYLDQDGDGWGIPDLRGPSRFCELPSNYSVKPGDCNDYDKRVNPMGTETCNLYDDDCDGQINEGLENVMVYRDEDGDGYGARLGEMKVGCGTGFGFASSRDDCDDTSKEIHPGVKEICNARDDDCNGRVDDGARASCGEGWCRRLAPTCDPSTCMPGQPRAETCNAFDDDCDGVADNGSNLCSEGRRCQTGFCLNQEEAAELAASKADGGVAESDGGVPASVGGRPNALPTESADPVRAARPSLGCTMSGDQISGRTRGGSVGFAATLLLLGLVRARRRRAQLH